MLILVLQSGFDFVSVKIGRIFNSKSCVKLLLTFVFWNNIINQKEKYYRESATVFSKIKEILESGYGNGKRIFIYTLVKIS